MGVNWYNVAWGFVILLAIGLAIAAIVMAAIYRPDTPAFSEQYFKFSVDVPNQPFQQLDMLVKLAYGQINENNMPTFDLIVATCKAVASDKEKYPSGTNPAVYVQDMGQKLSCTVKCVDALSLGGQANVNGEIVESVFTKGFISPVIMAAQVSA